MTTFTLVTVDIAGRIHHPAAFIPDKGSVLFLVREPHNSFDPNAVRIEDPHPAKDQLLGYVPRQAAIIVALLMDNGYKLDCVVADLRGPLAITVSINMPKAT